MKFGATAKTPHGRARYISLEWGGFCAALLFLFAAPVFAFTAPGSATGYVNDFAHTLQPQVVQQLDAELSQFEASTSNQIAVAIVPDMGGDYVEHYAEELFKTWGIGQKNRDNGVLLLISMQDHAVRIEVGYGLEGALPDSVAQRIINNDITPAFKAGHYDAGVTAAVQDIERATENEYTGTGTVDANPKDYAGIFFALFIALQWIAAILARSRSWWAGGVVGGVIGAGVWWYFALAALWGGVSFLGLIVLGLLFDYVVSNAYANSKQNGTRPPWWIGGGGMGGGRGGGFGGFGGGRSGGGGASGGW